METVYKEMPNQIVRPLHLSEEFSSSTNIQMTLAQMDSFFPLSQTGYENTSWHKNPNLCLWEMPKIKNCGDRTLQEKGSVFQLKFLAERSTVCWWSNLWVVTETKGHAEIMVLSGWLCLLELSQLRHPEPGEQTWEKLAFPWLLVLSHLPPGFSPVLLAGL